MYFIQSYLSKIQVLGKVTFSENGGKCCPIILCSSVLIKIFTLSCVVGRKKKEQHDANQAGMGLNPAFSGAYGATAVSISI